MLLFNLYLNTNILSDSEFDREGQKVPLGEARSNQTSGKNGFSVKTLRWHRYWVRWGKALIKHGETNDGSLNCLLFGLCRQSRRSPVDTAAICMKWCHHCAIQADEKVPLPAKNDTDLKAWSVVGEVGWNEWGDGEMCCHISVHAHTHAHKRIGKWFWNDGWGYSSIKQVKGTA